MEGYSEALHQAARFIHDHDRFLVVNHINPDGDATGSLLAVGLILKRLGKTFELVNEGKTPSRFSFLPMCDYIRNLESSDTMENSKYRYVITVDSADRSRVGKASELFEDGAILLNIDHHPTNDSYGTINVIRDSAASTTEVLYDLAQTMGVQLDNDLSTCLYVGLLTDTGGFRYANTSDNVMRVAADLLQFGVSPAEVADRCLETISEAYLHLLGRTLSSLEILADGRLAVISVTMEDMLKTGVLSEDVEGLVNYARNIEGVEVGISFKETDEKMIKVSFRSRKLDVSSIAKHFGGGGHVRASGCMLKGNLQQVKEKVISKVITELQKSG